MSGFSLPFRTVRVHISHMNMDSSVRCREHLCTHRHARPSVIFRSCVFEENPPLRLRLTVVLNCVDRQISTVVKASFFHLRQLAKVKPLLARQHFEKVIPAFITSRVDYCNALYYGVSQSSLPWLQLVQNAAAHLLTGARKREHITAIPASLHWLPVHCRVCLKFLLFLFKS